MKIKNEVAIDKAAKEEMCMPGLTKDTLAVMEARNS